MSLKRFALFLCIKRGHSDPANFRPSTLKCTPLKILPRACLTPCSQFCLLMGIMNIAFKYLLCLRGRPLIFAGEGVGGSWEGVPACLEGEGMKNTEHCM